MIDPGRSVPAAGRAADRWAMWTMILATAWIGNALAGDAAVTRDATFAAAHPDAEVLVLLDRVRLDVGYDDGLEAIVGEQDREQVYWIRDRRGVDAVNRQMRWTSPLFESDRFDVEIETATGKTRRLDVDDLTWIPFSDAGDGVYHLDRQVAYTVIEGLRPGDLLRVRERHRIRGLHGIPLVRVGDGPPTLRAEVEFAHPADHVVVVGATGRDEDLLRIESRTGNRRGRRSEHRSLDEVSGATTFVAHFTAVGQELPATAFAAGADWAAVGRGYAHRIDELLRPDPDLVTEARALTTAATSDRERVEILFRHVQTECRYLGLFDGLGGILPEPPTRTARRRFGDCKGLSALLIALLRAVDVDAHPALALTSAAGPLDVRVPNLAQFDHFVVWVRVEDGGAHDELWLDPTYDFCPASLFPPRNARWPILRVHTEDAGLVEIGPDRARAGALVYVVEGTLGRDGTVEASIAETATHTAGMVRRIVLARDGASASEAAESIVGRSLARHATNARGLDRPWDEPTVTVVDVRRARVGTPAAGALYLPRLLLDPPGGLEGDVPDDLRSWTDHVETWTLRLPAGASVTADSASIEAPGLRWSWRVASHADTLELRRRLEWDPRRLAPAEVDSLRQALRSIVQAEKGYLRIELGSDR